MNCQEAQSNVLNYINHKLTNEEITQFIEHIRECEDCRDELEIYYITMIGMQQLDEGELLTADFQKALKEAELKQTQTNTQIQQLNQKQTLLDQERQRLQTQLNAYSNELSNVEKAEESAIKNSTPKFS